MEQLNEIIIKLIKSALNKCCDDTINRENLTDEILEQIYDLSISHDICHLVSEGIYINRLIDQQSELGQRFFNERLKSLFRSEKQKFELNRISKLFEELEVEFVPLKGSVLRKYYPEAWMRTSCDIDILIKPEKLEVCKTALKENYGYIEGKTGEYDVSLFSPDNVHLELHFRFMESMFAASKSLNKIWQSVVPIEKGRYEHVIPDDVFYYHQVVHMAKHFEYGGCGIRFFIDLWVLNNSKIFNKTLKYNKYLKEVSLLKFEKEMSHLAEVWFSSEKHSDVSRRVEEYIMNAGIYGTQKNTMTTKQLKAGGKKKYFISRVFLRYEKLCEVFPEIKDKKYLIPYFQVKRWFLIINTGRLKNSIHELNVNFLVSQKDRDNISCLFNDLGL